MGVYGKLLRYVKEIRSEVALKTLLMIAVSALYVLQAVWMAQIVSLAFARADIKEILIRVAFVAACILVRSILLRYNEIFTKRMAQRIKGKLRLAILSKVFRLGPGEMSSRRSGIVTSLILDGIESLEPFFVSYVPQIFTVVLVGTVTFVYLFRYDPVSAVLLVCSMVICVVVPFITVPIMEKTVTNYWTEYSALTSQYIDSVQGMTTLKTLNAEKQKAGELRKDATSFWHRSTRNTGISLSNSALMIVLTAITSSITVVVCAVRAHAGAVPAEAVPAFLFMAVECARPMHDLNRHWHASFLGLSVARDLFTLLETEPAVKEAGEPIKSGIDSAPDIRMENVSFAYPGSGEVIHDVSFDIPAGKTTAIVGRSGSGKSTLLNLLLRFYDPQKGRITINGTDIKKFGLDYLESNTATVFQDTFLFYGTVAENIRMARPDAPDEDIIAAAKAAGAHEFITELPQGYDTMVGERGLMLSGGERQRLAIARAILKDTPILFLDEATSSVDAGNEARIQDAVTRFAKDRTTVIIAHRLSTIRNADKIVVIDDGRLVEEGTHDELIRERGAYYALVRAQEVIGRE